MENYMISPVEHLTEYYIEGGGWAFEPDELSGMITWVDGLKGMASRDLQFIPRSEGGGFTKQQLDEANELSDLEGPGCKGGEWLNVSQEISEYLDQQEMFNDYIKFEQEQSKEHLLRHHSNIAGENILQPSGNLFLPFNLTCGSTYIVCELGNADCFLISAGSGDNGYCIGVTEYGTVWIPPKMKKSIIAAQSKYRPEEQEVSLDPTKKFSIAMRAVGGSANPWKATWINL